MNILDPRFKYVNAASTDIRKTFARARRQARKVQAEQQRTPSAAGATLHVLPSTRKNAA